MKAPAFGRERTGHATLFDAILAATAAEASFAGAGLGLLALAGALNGWFDVAAQLVPLWFVLAALGGLLALASIGKGRGRVAVLAAAVTGLGANGLLMGPELLRAATAVAAERSNSRALKVLTFNSWSNNIDPRGSVDGVLRANADVVALQETEGLSASAWRRLLAAYPFYTSCKPECDLFLLSKTPWSADGSEQHPVRGGYFTMVWASTAAPDGRPLTLATTHYAWPLPPAQQAGQRAALAQAVRGLDTSDLILTGDFNLTPWSAAMRRQDAALAPLQRRTFAMFSWPANIAVVKWPAPFPLLPIDHVYAGPAWRTVAVQRLPRLGSDHYPVLVTLSRP